MGKKITIVTVVYNNFKQLEYTIKSVISQSYCNYEYIIIDGGSTDGTIDIIKKYSDHIGYWISESDNGIYDAMNKAIKIATGDWICFMNSGDSFADSSVLSNIASHKIDGYDVIFGDTIVINEYGKQLVKAKRVEYLLENMPFCHQSSFVKTSYINSVLYDTSYRFVADYNFFYQSYIQQKKFLYIPITISIYDTTEGFSASNKKKVFKEILRVRKDTDNLKNKCLLFGRYYRYKLAEIIKLFFPSFIKHIRTR